MILERTNWADPSDLIISDIYEYDMKSGGLSIIQEKKLLSDQEIKKILSMDKHDAHKYIGNLQRTNDKIKLIEKVYFKEFRLLFGEINGLKDEDIVAIKKDAIFTRKYCSITQIGEYVQFREKNHYQAFLRLPKKELFWDGDNGKIDVKGLSDEKVELHRDYILKDISSIIGILSMYDYDTAKLKLVRLMNDYKTLQLPIEYYREFNPESCYRQIFGDRILSIHEDVGEYYKKDLIIEYNYLNVLVPLLSLIS